MKHKKKLKKIYSLITSFFIGLALVLVLLIVGPKFIGMQTYIVLSGSMEPTYHTGSLIYVKEVDPYTLNEGDPITFKVTSTTVATHRIVEIKNENGEISYRTKGDANDMIDGSPVKPEDILGKAVFSIPKLGYFASYIQTPSGTYLMIAYGCILVLLMVISELLFEDDNKKNKSKKKN